MAVVDSRAIEAGSMAYGDRQMFESNLPQALAAEAQTAGAPTGGGSTLAIPEDPLGALLSGELSGDPNLPLTAGLSVGDGPGPAAVPDVMTGNRAEKLRMLASEATSPLIQAAARNELRRMAREGI